MLVCDFIILNKGFLYRSIINYVKYIKECLGIRTRKVRFE